MKRHTEKDRLALDQRREAEMARLNAKKDLVHTQYESLQNLIRWRSLYLRDTAEAYVKGYADIRLELSTTDSESAKFHLVFRGIIPDADDLAEFRNTGNEYSVFIGISQLVQSPQVIIPSTVWLEPAYDLNYFYRNFFASSSYRIFKISWGITAAGKVAPLSTDSEHHLIESIPQVSNSVSRDLFQIVRERLIRLDLLDVVASVRLLLDHNAIRLSGQENIQLPCKILNVMFAPSDRSFGAMKDIFHSKKGTI